MEPWCARKVPKTNKGASLVEYGIILGLVAVLSVPALLGLGGSVGETFVEVESAVRVAGEDTPTGPGAVDEEEEALETFVLRSRLYTLAQLQATPPFVIHASEMLTPGYSYRINGQAVTSHNRIDASSTPPVGPEGVLYERIAPELDTCELATYLTRTRTTSSRVVHNGNQLGGTFSVVTTDTFEHDTHGWERHVSIEEISTNQATGQTYRTVSPGGGAGGWTNNSLGGASLPNRPVPAGC